MGRVEPSDAIEVGTGPSDFAHFYRAEFEGQVRRAALLLDATEAAHDVVQDAFVAVLRRWDTLDDPGPYLNRCVLNGCRDRHRRRARHDRALDRLAPVGSVASTPEILWDVLAELPFNQRAAVVLRFYARMTESEIAAVLECPTGSVGPWITRALRRMEGKLR